MSDSDRQLTNKEIMDLAEFYGVKTVRELISIQDFSRNHLIEKLSKMEKLVGMPHNQIVGTNRHG